MGVILEPTPNMGPWRTEVRSRSAYIKGGQLRAHRHDDGDMHTGFAVPISQSYSLLAALNQIIEHPSFLPEDTAGVGHWTEWTIDSGWLYLSGPCYVYGAAGTGWVPASVAMMDGAEIGMFEIDYSTMLAARNLLRAALTAFVTDTMGSKA